MREQIKEPGVLRHEAPCDNFNREHGTGAQRERKFSPFGKEGEKNRRVTPELTSRVAEWKTGNLPGALMSVRLGDALLSRGPVGSLPSPKLNFLAAGGAAITSSLLGSETLP